MRTLRVRLWPASRACIIALFGTCFWLALAPRLGGAGAAASPEATAAPPPGTEPTPPGTVAPRVPVEAPVAPTPPLTRGPGQVHLRLPGPIPVEMVADRVEASAGGVVRGIGHVHVVRSTDALRAREATYDPATGDITALGDVVLTQPERTLRADRLRYNVRTRAASSEGVRAELPSPRPDVTYYVEGDTISGTPERIEVRGGLFSTCPPDHRHWGVGAREIVLQPGQRLVARNVSLIVLGARIITIPRIGLNLARRLQGAQPPLIPRLLLGRTDLIGVGTDFEFSFFRQATVNAYGILSARHVVRGGARIERFGDVPLGIRLGYKEDASSRFISGLTVSDLPAFTFFLPELFSSRGGLQIGQTESPAPRLVLSGDIDSLPWDESRRFRVVGAGSVGRFTEHPTERTAGRLNLAGAFEVRPIAMLPHVGLGAGFSGRLALYDTRQRYGVVTPYATATWQPSRADTLEARSWFSHIAGSTPFYFDRLDAASRLLLTWQRRTTGYGVRLSSEMDLATQGLYAWEVGYSRRIHCIQPGLVVGGRGGDFRLGVTLAIPGISN